MSNASSLFWASTSKEGSVSLVIFDVPSISALVARSHMAGNKLRDDYCRSGALYVIFKNGYKAPSGNFFTVYKAPFAFFSRLGQSRHPELICVIIIDHFRRAKRKI